MNLKASYFSFSKALIKENFRRFWSIPLISFLLYFLSGILPLLLSTSTIRNGNVFLELFLNNHNPIFILGYISFPILVACAVLEYMHKSSSATFVNTLPLSRGKVFNSNVVSGWLMCILPLALIFIIVLCISLVADISSSYVLRWFFETILIITLPYAIAVFASTITGTTGHHAIMSVFLTCMLPAVFLIFAGYKNIYFWGYSTESLINVAKLHPIAEKLATSNNFSLKLSLIYIAVSLLLIVVSFILNYKRKVEKTGEGIVFVPLKTVLCYIMSFIGMSTIGIFFYETDLSKNDFLNLYIGLLIGAVFSFILSKVIVENTFRIFNKSALKNFGIYALISAFLISSIAFDFTNSESRVISPSYIDSASVDLLYQVDEYQRYMPSLFGYTNMDNFQFENPQNIELIRQCHKTIVDNKEILKKDEVQLIPFNFRYNKNNSLKLARNYAIDKEEAEKLQLISKYIAPLYESKEFKEYYSLKNLNDGTPDNISIISSHFYYSSSSEYSVNLNKDDISEFIKVLDSDFTNRTYEEATSHKLPYATVSLQYLVPKASKDYQDKYKTYNVTGDALVEREIDVYILESDYNTIQWLEDKGIYSLNEKASNEIACAEVSISETTNEDGVLTYEETTLFTIYNKEQIDELLDIGLTSITHNEDSYYSIVFYNDPSKTNDMFNLFIPKDEAPKFFSLQSVTPISTEGNGL